LSFIRLFEFIFTLPNKTTDGCETEAELTFSGRAKAFRTRSRDPQNLKRRKLPREIFDIVSRNDNKYVYVLIDG
jgi:hypothetical protein